MSKRVSCYGYLGKWENVGKMYDAMAQVSKIGFGNRQVLCHDQPLGPLVLINDPFEYFLHAGTIPEPRRSNTIDPFRFLEDNGSRPFEGQSIIHKARFGRVRSLSRVRPRNR